MDGRRDSGKIEKRGGYVGRDTGRPIPRPQSAGASVNPKPKPEPEPKRDPKK